jgi:hypothetical protein
MRNGRAKERVENPLWRAGDFRLKERSRMWGVGKKKRGTRYK